MGSSQLYVERYFLVYKVISRELNGLSLSKFQRILLWRILRQKGIYMAASLWDLKPRGFLLATMATMASPYIFELGFASSNDVRTVVGPDTFFAGYPAGWPNISVEKKVFYRNFLLQHN